MILSKSYKPKKTEHLFFINEEFEMFFKKAKEILKNIWSWILTSIKKMIAFVIRMIQIVSMKKVDNLFFYGPDYEKVFKYLVDRVDDIGDLVRKFNNAYPKGEEPSPAQEEIQNECVERSKKILEDSQEYYEKMKKESSSMKHSLSTIEKLRDSFKTIYTKSSGYADSLLSIAQDMINDNVDIMNKKFLPKITSRNIQEMSYNFRSLIKLWIHIEEDVYKEAKKAGYFIDSTPSMKFNY